jgi:solute carrier family 66, member 2
MNRIMTLLKWVITHIAPLFIVTSPVTSYADQIWSISKNRSSAGFSLDIPLIMLVASILK